MDTTNYDIIIMLGTGVLSDLKGKERFSLFKKRENVRKKYQKSAKMRDLLLTPVVTQNGVVSPRTNQNATCRPDHLVLWTSSLIG